MSRRTQQRKAIRQVFECEGRPLTPLEVLDSAQKSGCSLGIATVYRNLKSLMDEGYLEAVELPKEPTRYELANQGPHHHFQCEDCTRVYFLPVEVPVHPRKHSLDKFRIERQSVVFYGRCPTCLPITVPN